MPAVDEMLAQLADHPPAEPSPVGVIRGRARRRVRRRRALTTAAAAVVLLAVGVGVGAAVTADGPADEVVADSGATSPSSTSAPPTGPLTSVDRGLALDPASGYEDGTSVAITLEPPASGPITIAQCGPDLTRAPPGEALSSCGSQVAGDAADPPDFVLARTVETATGPVDCAEEAGLCTLVVRVGGPNSTDERAASLVFRDDLPAVVGPAVTVDGDEGTVGDGDTLLVTLTGVQTGESVTVHQCWVQDPTAGVDGRRCSAARSRQTIVREGPETQLTFTAFHDVLVNRSTNGGYTPAWTPCTPCVLQVEIGSRPAPLAGLPMQMEPTATPVRPTVEIDPGGPLAPGSTVTVRAAGLQPGSRVPVGWCPADRAQGGGDPPCDLPLDPDGDGVLVGDDGTLAVAGFPLPPAGVQVHGVDCSVAGACVIGLDAGDAFSTMAFAPLDLSG